MIQSVLAALFYVLQNLSNKVFSEKFKSGLYPLAVLNALALTIGTALLFLFNRPAMLPAAGMGFAFLFGVLFVLTISMLVLTMSRGPLGLSSLIVDMNVIITVLFGAVVWRERISLVQGLGLVILLGVIVALAIPDQKEAARKHRLWLITALSTLLLNGILNIEQTAAFKVCPDLSSADFTFWSMAIGAGICIVLAIVLKVFTRARFDPEEPLRKLPLLAAGLGVGTAVAYYFHNEALVLLPSLIVFPVVIGLNNGLLMLFSVIFFKEKLSLRKGLAFAAGLVGILLTNL